MTLLGEDLPFAMQVAVWGAAWSGHASEVVAFLCEHRGDCPLHPWDHHDEYLSSGVVITDEGVTRLPYRYALPFAADYMIRTGVSQGGDDA